MKLTELFKSKKYAGAAVVLAVGIIVMCIGGATPGAPPETAEHDPTRDIELRLEKTLSSIMGAGKVDVFIMLDDYGTAGYVSDTKTSEKEGETMTETRTVISGTGKMPVLARELAPQVRGVIIVADGADNAAVKQSLKNAAEAALAVMPHRIEVARRKK